MKSINPVSRDEHATKRDDLFMSLELGDKRWKLSIGDARHGASRYDVAAGDTAAIAKCIAKTSERFQTPSDAVVHSCYEAGRDGWWLHRWLAQIGVDNIVVDASSIEVNRRARRAKTDRLDADKLRTMLMRHHSGEHVWSVLREPTEQDEDARRVHRELQRLTTSELPISIGSARCSCFTTSDQTSSLPGATGPRGGRSTANRLHRSCARRSSERLQDSTWSRTRFARSSWRAGGSWRAGSIPWCRS